MASQDDFLASTLEDKISDNMEHETDLYQRFFPESRWNGLWKPEEVEATLRKYRTDPAPDLVNFILNRAPKIFAILVDMRQPDLITRFQRQDFGQEKLPIQPASAQELLRGKSSISNFCDKQWSFIAPTFTKERFRYKFSKFHRLPYTTTGKKANPGASHYSKVKERSIHALAKDNPGNPRVAVKELLSSEPGPAEQEASVLEMVRGLPSDHMIKAIAYYQHGEKHYFMFPWAEHGNLWEFWTTGSGARLDKPYIIWVFRQLTGLADAIEKLHDRSQSRSCRHGDLKPENILCFRHGDNERDTETPAVRMVITDVGLARDHIERTQFRESTNTRVSTKRYAGPEMDVNPGGALSRRFDIWSMGCIFLELVLWILYGKEELVKCTKTLNSTFYKIIRDTSGRTTAEVNPIVQKWLSYILKDWRCSEGTALEKLVQLIINKLLVVNVQDSPRSSSSGTPLKSRTYAPGMRQDLEGILKGLETNRIKPLTDKWIYTPDDGFATAFFYNLPLTTRDRPVQKPQLCRRCRGLPLWSIQCHFTDSQTGLDTSAQETGCELCSLLSYCIRDRSYSPRDHVHFSRVGSYLTVDEGRGRPVVNLCTTPGSGIKSLQNVQTGFSRLPEAGSEAHFKVLREWIRSCNSTHHCVPKQLDFIPSRLLHISHVDSDHVQLVERDHRLNQPVKYAAMSHRWGSPDHHERFCTTTANIQGLKDGFKVSDLPKTFRDAASVARGLGLEYLWIDSVCIVQDDAEDWDIESKLMEQVFSSAYCTLAASCASGTNDGFLKARPVRRCIPMTFGEATYYACENIDDFGTHVDQSELNQRGWVMQERALSRRTIYFVENQSYWECGGGVRCETMTKMNNRKASFLGDANFPHSAEKYVKGLKIEFFQDLYVRYSKLALSFAFDRPIAIKGLENRLLSTFNTTGGYGVLDRYFHRSLLWKRGGDTLRRITNTRSEPVPSWSWMAYDGAIDYVSAPGGKVSWFNNIKSPFSQAPSESSHHEDEPLALKAPVRSIINDPPDESIFLDEPARALTQPMECIVLGSINPGSSGNLQRHWVILVQRISNDDGPGGGVYERVGVAVLEGRHIDFRDEAREIRIQ
ncbi:hypothetical protein CEP54_012298 [Fusarium duplospermum]|uniref:Protein kinase domain-containing protein n=1 Tax=Fusarium duplospermum TaxID=1325734 RepID=A0A428P9K4_9HYPO|nr:hypothetical protein CEP54_012298 [Fusarium duplospermum]